MPATRWTESDIPDQTGRNALVTGANSGIGLETARALAVAGATVLLGCRDPARAAAAVESVRRDAPDADVRPVAIDLADLSSIHSAAATVIDLVGRLHLLINNAGVMAVPQQQTPDGFELQLAPTTSDLSRSPVCCSMRSWRHPVLGSSPSAARRIASGASTSTI